MKELKPKLTVPEWEKQMVKMDTAMMIQP